MRTKQSLKDYYPFPTSVYLSLADKIYRPLKYGENSVVINPPLYGRDHVFLQLQEQTHLQSHILGSHLSRFTFGYIHLDSEVEDSFVWISQMERSLYQGKSNSRSIDVFKKKLLQLIESGYEPTFFINIPETLDDELFKKFLDLAQRVYYFAPSRIHFLLFFDSKWDEEFFFSLITPFRSLFQNTTILSLYSDIEVSYFIRSYCRKWKVRLSRVVISYIIQQSGGILLLAKAAVRICFKERFTQLRDVKTIFLQNDDYIMQLKFFYYRLTKIQQHILHTIANKKDTGDEKELLHLERMGIVVKDGFSFKVRSLSLDSFLCTGSLPNKQIILSLRNSEIFSRRDTRIVSELLRKRGEIVSRDFIADILWKEKKYEKYSDWAMDQAVSRIRRKLKSFSVTSHLVLETHKKRGFSLN